MTFPLHIFIFYDKILKDQGKLWAFIRAATHGLYDNEAKVDSYDTTQIMHPSETHTQLVTELKSICSHELGQCHHIDGNGKLFDIIAN